MRRALGSDAWSPPAELVPGDVGGRGPVKNKPIRLAHAAWLAPASIETEAAWDCFVDRSEDGGRTWIRSGLVPRERRAFTGLGIIQPTLWESAPGRVHMLARSTEGRIYRSDSEDDGRTWRAATPTPLPNNNRGIDLAPLAGGTLVLAFNPVGMNGDPRTPLVLAASRDNGERWERVAVVEEGPGEFS